MVHMYVNLIYLTKCEGFSGKILVVKVLAVCQYRRYMLAIALQNIGLAKKHIYDWLILLFDILGWLSHVINTPIDGYTAHVLRAEGAWPWFFLVIFC